MKSQDATLGELGEWGSGGTPRASRREFYGGDIPWLIIEDLTDGLVERSSQTITKLGLDNSTARIVPPGTLLVAMYGSIGKLGIAGISCATNQAIAFCKPDSAKVDTDYLFYLLLHSRPDFINAGRGGTQQNISQEFLKSYKVTLPDLPEQRRIASLLVTLDRLRRMRRYAVSICGELRPAMFLERYIGDGGGAPLVTVEELAYKRPNAIRTGPFGSQLLHSEFTHKGIAVLGIDNVVNNRFQWAVRRFISPAKFDELKRYQVSPGDVLITIMGTCGRCAVVPADIGTAINTKHLCCISLDRDRCLPGYLQGAFLYDPQVRHQLEIATRGAIMDGLNMEIIRALQIPLPPLRIQEAFVAVSVEHERLIAVQREAQRHADNLFDSTLHEAFVSCESV